MLVPHLSAGISPIRALDSAVVARQGLLSEPSVFLGKYASRVPSKLPVRMSVVIRRRAVLDTPVCILTRIQLRQTQPESW